MKNATLTATSCLSLKSDSYVYKIVPNNIRIAAILSDDSLRIIDQNTLQEIPDSVRQTAHKGVTCLETDGSSVVTAGRDGVVRYWDLRARGKALEFWDGSGAAYLSLCLGENGPAVGTELQSSQASVIVWDNRNLTKPSLQYVESHNDDVTVVQFQPQRSQKLISGSTDGLVNLYDLTQKDEDEALIQVANHGSSINHAGFLSASQFFALSHDEKFSIYHVDDQENLTDDLPPTAFGDLRPRINCEYVVDVIPSGAGEAIIGAGSHSKQELDLVALRLTEGSWELDPYNTIRLPGAHGEEIVRSMYFDHSAHAIFTAGEDGKIKAWRTTGAVDNSETQVEDAEVEWPRKKKKKRNSTDKGDGKGRFKPY